jgi:hypothetical protein
MKIETTTHTIDIFPIRKVRISYKCDDNMEDDFHRVCQKDLIIDRENTIGMNQQQSTLVLNQMRQANTDVVGNGKVFYMMRGNSLIPINHYSFHLI